MNDFKLVSGVQAKGEATGKLSATRLQKQIDLLQEIGVLDHPVKVGDVATFEFIPKD
jgi:NitT/TauT family transport system substrate-binding protein